MSFDLPLPAFNANDPHATFLGLSSLDLLLIEIVPMTYRMVDEQGSPKKALDEENERQLAFYKLESLGYRVGLGLAERFSRDRPRLIEPLDVIKFLCKDLWTLLFRKQVDNLKTNHRGVYVLTDNAFRPLQRMSTEVGGQLIPKAQPYLWFPCGIIRGVLASMNINAKVQADTSALPIATFHINTNPTKP